MVKHADFELPLPDTKKAARRYGRDIYNDLTDDSELVECGGFEPPVSAMRMLRFTN